MDKPMKKNLVNLNINPCNMCMPMGTVTALYGIKKCMTILHGSQGCSTYMRRHMATHYNEPIDIASSSLTEEGTVYGGEKNLKEGLKNLITVYQPEVIGVATTCLAETIGEDTKRIIEKFYKEYPMYENILIIPISSPGYGGTQYEGFFGGLYEIVRHTPIDVMKNQKVNVISGQLSPADTRYLKTLLESFHIDYILLPDLSENLDRGYEKEYNKLPSKGTSIKDICKMGGARYTIELSSFTKKNNSVAEYLFEHYQVPYEKLPLPIGLRDNDKLINCLESLSGRKVPSQITGERSRYLDGMIDSHKYNSEGRAVIFGEPDFVYSTVRLCLENGIFPLVVATSSKCQELKSLIYEEVNQLREAYFLEKFEILDDVDFKTIEYYAKTLGANLFIGNSDARRIEEHLGIPLVRRGFPIHDRIGGQRLRTIGFEGALTFLDDITNTILEKKESGFRKVLYQMYYKEEIGEEHLDNKELDNKKMGKNVSYNDDMYKDEPDKEDLASHDIENITSMVDDDRLYKIKIEDKTKTHPCYNACAGDYARIHLPVAPKCNISCNYCLRKYDCPNESRPGVTTNILTPVEAYDRYKIVKERVKNLTVVGIAGPGDALANFDETKETLKFIRNDDENVTFCLSTNGLLLPKYVEELYELGVSHVTVTLNTIDPNIGARIYKYVDYMGIRYTGEEGAAILLMNQLLGIKMLTDRGIICKVNIVMLKGLNDLEIPNVVKKVKELGATITNIMQLIPVKGSVFEDIPLVSNKEIMDMRKHCGETMKQMYHCKQCRADAIGTLDEDRSFEYTGCSSVYKEIESTNLIQNLNPNNNTIIIPKPILDFVPNKIPNKTPNKTLKFATATKSGMLIDEHFGHVSELYIYEYKNGEALFKEKRNIKKYCDGSEYCESSEPCDDISDYDESKHYHSEQYDGSEQNENIGHNEKYSNSGYNSENNHSDNTSYNGDKISMILHTIADCDGVIAMRIGLEPTKRLEKQGIHVFTTYDRIEDAVIKAADNILEK